MMNTSLPSGYNGYGVGLRRARTAASTSSTATARECTASGSFRRTNRRRTSSSTRRRVEGPRFLASVCRPVTLAKPGAGARGNASQRCLWRRRFLPSGPRRFPAPTICGYVRAHIPLLAAASFSIRFTAVVSAAMPRPGRRSRPECSRGTLAARHRATATRRPSTGDFFRQAKV